MHASVQHLQRSAILNQIRFFRGHRLACKVAQQYSSTSPQVAGGTDVVQETARALRGELRRMFETGVRHANIIHSLTLLPVAKPTQRPSMHCTCQLVAMLFCRT
jgi:hypothetical protein